MMGFIHFAIFSVFLINCRCHSTHLGNFQPQVEDSIRVNDCTSLPLRLVYIPAHPKKFDNVAYICALEPTNDTLPRGCDSSQAALIYLTEVDQFPAVAEAALSHSNTLGVVIISSLSLGELHKNPHVEQYSAKFTTSELILDLMTEEVLDELINYLEKEGGALKNLVKFQRTVIESTSSDDNNQHRSPDAEFYFFVTLLMVLIVTILWWIYSSHIQVILSGGSNLVPSSNAIQRYAVLLPIVKFCSLIFLFINAKFCMNVSILGDHYRTVAIIGSLLEISYHAGLTFVLALLCIGYTLTYNKMKRHKWPIAIIPATIVLVVSISSDYTKPTGYHILAIVDFAFNFTLLVFYLLLVRCNLKGLNKLKEFIHRNFILQEFIPVITEKERTFFWLFLIAILNSLSDLIAVSRASWLIHNLDFAIANDLLLEFIDTFNLLFLLTLIRCREKRNDFTFESIVSRILTEQQENAMTIPLYTAEISYGNASQLEGGTSGSRSMLSLNDRLSSVLSHDGPIIIINPKGESGLSRYHIATHVGRSSFQ